MKDTIDVGAIGTFGLPNGCTQSAFYSGKFLGNKSLDLNANEIKVFPNTVLFAVKREIVNNEPSLVFTKYTFAKEKNSNRGGTFIGSCICFYNSYASANQIYSLLNELHLSLTENENNILNSVLQVSHSKDLKVKLPKDFEKLQQNLKPFEPVDSFGRNINPHKNFIVYSDDNGADKIVAFFENCIAYFQDNETVYFTNDREIAEFVREKNLLKIESYSEFKKEIDAIQLQREEDIKRQEILRIEELRRLEFLKKEEERKIQEQKSSDEQKRSESEQEKRFVSKRSIPNQQKIKYDDHKNLIIDYNRLLDLYTGLTQRNAAASLYSDKQKTSHSSKSKGSKSRKILFYIVIPFVCFLLLISNVYFLFFQEPKIEFKEKNIITEKPIVKKDSLNPLPNNELSQPEKKALFKNSIKDKKISELVQIIFKNNPTEIATIYGFQKHSYQENLYELNKTYFKIEKDTICINDTIDKIPSFKRNPDNQLKTK